jgi:hypothetical protein
MIAAPLSAQPGVGGIAATAFGWRTWREPVANAAALPTCNVAATSHARMALDTWKVYVCDGAGAWNTPAGGPTNYAASASPAGPAQDLSCTDCIGSTEIDESTLFGAGDVPAAETDSAHDTAEEVGAVSKQATTPGIAETGNSNLTGTVIAGTQLSAPKLVTTAAGVDVTAASAFGASISIAGGGSTNHVTGLAASATNTLNSTGSGGPIGVQSFATVATGVTTTNSEGIDATSFVSGITTSSYGISNQIAALPGGSIGTAYGNYSDVLTSGTGAISTAYGYLGKVRSLGVGGALGTVYGLALDGWSGIATTSYGLFLGSSIDIGTTRYAIYSESTAPSVLSGPLTVPIAAVTSDLDVFGPSSGTTVGVDGLALALDSSNNAYFWLRESGVMNFGTAGVGRLGLSNAGADFSVAVGTAELALTPGSVGSCGSGQKGHLRVAADGTLCNCNGAVWTGSPASGSCT